VSVKSQEISENAKNLSALAHEIAIKDSTCYPNWRTVEKESGLDSDSFLSAFDELCKVGIIFAGLPSFLTDLYEQFPIESIFVEDE